jgi:hypothetical protein
VSVDLGATALATISHDLMGVHTAVYDGDIGLASTAARLKAAGVTSLRYPGGSYADLYHWETHTGTTTPAAGAGSNVIYIAPEANMGKFVSILENVGANAFITVNYGINSRATGPAARRRPRPGSPTPTVVPRTRGSSAPTTPIPPWIS